MYTECVREVGMIIQLHTHTHTIKLHANQIIWQKWEWLYSDSECMTNKIIIHARVSIVAILILINTEDANNEVSEIHDA